MCIFSADTIDGDQKDGELKIFLFNHSKQEFQVKRGESIAQLICERIHVPELQEVEVGT